jgi:uncharacterized protein
LWHDLSPATILAFAACVALATVVQNLTGFALGLIMLGFVAMLQLVPLADAANASMVLALINALVFFRASRNEPPWRFMRPAWVSGLIGVVLGVALLAWLSANATEWLRLVLGVSIAASASVLVMQGRKLQRPSSARSLAGAGFLSGILGGLFAASGPPMVFHMFRQPLEPETIRRCLMLVFALNSAVRLVLVVAAGGFSLLSVTLVAIATPLVLGITHLMAARPVAISRLVLNRVAAGFLGVTGGLLALSAARHILGAGP